MIILDASTRKLQAVLAGAVTTNQLPVTVAWTDIHNTSEVPDKVVPGASVINTNNTTAVDIVAAPASGYYRQIKTITIYNADTVSATVLVRYNDNGTTYVIARFVLPTLATLVFTDLEGWKAYDSTGSLAQSQSLTLTGHVTGSGIGSFATTIASSTVTEAMQVLADNTTQDVTSTKHGYAPKSPADATKFLNGAATPAFALVKDSDLSTSDITTNNASTSKHGFLKKLSNVSTEFMNGQGDWATPAGGAGGGLIARTVLTSGSGNHTTQSGTTYVILRLQAAGGGSGGCGTTNVSKVSGAGGGGQYVEKRIAVSGSTAYAYAVGAAGTAGANTGGNGGTGGNTTFTVGGTTYTANGGSGGTGINADSGNAGKNAGGAGGTGTHNGDFAIDGQAGMPGYYILTSATDSYYYFVNGKGGDSHMGLGGNADGFVPTTSVTVVGKAGTGYGSGGAGSYNQTTATLGRAGQGGILIVEEY